MAIEFHCSKCGNLVKAPDQAGGKRGKCPYCQESVYIPLPESAIEVIPLAPIDPEEEARAARMEAEMVRAAAQLDHDRVAAPEKATHSKPSDRPIGVPDDDVQSEIPSQIVAFLRCMSKSNLEEADHVVASLKATQGKAKAEVQRLLMDGLPPAGVTDIPPPLVQGFLKTLLQRL